MKDKLEKMSREKSKLVGKLKEKNKECEDRLNELECEFDKIRRKYKDDLSSKADRSAKLK